VKSRLVDATDSIVIGESLFEEMKRYVRFGKEDARLLNELLPHAEPHFERIAAEFYERIREHEDAHKVFTGEPQVERLKRSLVGWMRRVFTGPYDRTYFLETAKIGRIHVRVGLPQHYMFTAMALIRVAIEQIADARMNDKAQAARAAISRILDLELAIMVDAYRHELEKRLQRITEMEREQADRALAKTEHRYMKAVELARVLVVGLDADARIRLFNREAERVTELDRDEVAGRSFVDALLPEVLREEHGSLIEAAAAKGKLASDTLESAVRTKSGKVREVKWQLAYVPLEEDAEVVLFAIGVDTTDQNALARRVRQSEKLAAVGTLAAGLAHEIRNPLNGAALHVTFLERGLKRSGADTETQGAVNVIGEEIKRLSALVSEFLDFARPQPLQKRAVSIRALCERAAQIVAPDAARANVEVKMDLPVADLTLDLDPGKMEQVLLNLLKNAIEAQEPVGSGTVTVRVRRQPRQEIIEIEDEGPGLTEPHAPIFDPFFSTKPTGTGLGLAIVHRIVTDHEGTIDVHSQPGKTIFRITLPIRLAG
jgi:PAS domain S-box-containing protein